MTIRKIPKNIKILDFICRISAFNLKSMFKRDFDPLGAGFRLWEQKAL
jgi:hypothetical protein